MPAPDPNALLQRLTACRAETAATAAVDALPVLLRLSQADDRATFAALLVHHPGCQVHDTIETQLRDLVKLEHPARCLTKLDYQQLIEEKLAGRNSDEYGVWVYYPWRNCFVHFLNEADFVRVRTIRNAYKITPAEQQQLAGKKVGVVGLSVGQSVTLALALERIAGEIRIADFDTLELSNLNRIRAGVASLGLPKTTVVRREIAEIDPFLRVVTFEEGITPGNVDAFLHEGGPLDLLVEECDNLAIKVLLREQARRGGIPVLMETSDRGMLDVERYDLDPAYPVLHGRLPAEASYEHLAALRTPAERLPHVLALLGPDTLSDELKTSMAHIGHTITTWPQLGTDVMLGGAIAASTARRILLGHPIASGRRYFDIGPALLAERTELKMKN